VGAYLAFARVEVIALLTDHRAVVLAVADALVARRTLSGTEIDSIIDTEMSA
jgi:ATP-dependent Zn protease